MRRAFIKYLIILLAIHPVSKATLYAQSAGTAANFGIDSSCYSGSPISGVDDWFQGLSGDGILDQSDSTFYYNQLFNDNNIAFDVDMDVPKYSRPNGYILYDAKFIRDQIKFSGSDGDATTFTGSKNGQDPEDWLPSGTGNISGKNDIVDGYIHMRRDGGSVADSLWMMMGITTLETAGDHFFDFEMFFSDLTFTGAAFINSGPDEGHNSWDFDGSGEIIQTGDLSVGFAVSGGGITNFEVRIWTSRVNYNTTTPAHFAWGPEFDGSKNNSVFGYASIIINSSDFFAVTNGSSTKAPPWGTHVAGANFSTTYPTNYLAEVAVNLTAIGLNNFLSLPGVNPCLSPFAKVMAKSRSSQSFTSALGDFTSPVEFSANSLIDSSSSQIADLYSCDSMGILVPTNPVIGAYYEWTTTDGLFDNGTQISIGDTAIAALPGTYTLSSAPLAECTRGMSEITIDAHPCAVDDIDTVAHNSMNNIILVLDNDYDLDGNLDISTIGVTGLLPPTNGILIVDAVNGHIEYTPDSSYFGLDSFEYYVCDSTAKCDTAFVLLAIIVENCFDNIDNNGNGLIDCYDPDCYLAAISGDTDTDGDGIGDYCDLDDDNDGIPDIDECFSPSEAFDGLVVPDVFYHTGSAGGSPVILDSIEINGIPYKDFTLPDSYSFDFSGNLPIGVNDILIYNNGVIDAEYTSSPDWNVDALPTFLNLNMNHYQYINNHDMLDGFDYFQVGYSTPIMVNEELFVTVSERTGNNSVQVQALDLLQNPLGPKFDVDFTEYEDSGVDIDPGNENLEYFTIPLDDLAPYGSLVYFIRIYDNHPVADAADLKIMIFGEIDKTCADSDNDGIVNAIDLDSDNDGILDVHEAGHGMSAGIDGRILDVIANVGINGLDDRIETSADSDTISYIISDSETVKDSIYDAYELDSDDDGCFDADEEEVVDLDEDGIAGSGVPAVDASGLVIVNLPYAPPPENVWQNPAISGCEICYDPIFPDSDADGFNDVCDLDDDNDGIPDEIEVAVKVINSLPSCSTDPVFDFSAIPILLSGVDRQEGAVYRFINVDVGIDAIVTIEQLVNATIPILDDNGTNPEFFNPQTMVVDLPNGEQAYHQYRFVFVNSGTSTPSVLGVANLTFNDNDGNPLMGEQIQALDPTLYAVHNPTELTISQNDPFIVGTAGEVDYPGVTNVNPQSNFYVRYENVSEFVVRFGILSRDPDSLSVSGRQHSLSFSCSHNFINPLVYSADTDQDGIPNRLDLDSDNDGILDVYEAGHGLLPDSTGRIDGVLINVGTNGLDDRLETIADNDSLNYNIADSETTQDSIYDPYELDSDGDGCFDSLEEAVSDSDGDGIAGTGTPSVDSLGLVISIKPYVVPPNNVWQDPASISSTCGCQIATMNPHIMYYRRSN